SKSQNHARLGRLLLGQNNATGDIPAPQGSGSVRARREAGGVSPMSIVLAAGLTLILGAALALMIPSNPARAWAALLTQAIATVLVLVAAVPVVMKGTPVSAEWTWSFPVEVVRVRIDGLS